jgi:hypothetical protein
LRLELTHFTDPACPSAFSAEPVRMRSRPKSALVAQLDLQKKRAAFSRVATPLAAGADFYWTLTP